MHNKVLHGTLKVLIHQKILILNDTLKHRDGLP